jgi:acyl-coenzyme A synthetase/AMP-(fatty) acid ligase
MIGGDFNLYTHFQEQFAKHADDELLCTEQDRSYTYSDIDRRSSRFARFLTDLGASPGDRVSVQVDKSPLSATRAVKALFGRSLTPKVSIIY